MMAAILDGGASMLTVLSFLFLVVMLAGSALAVLERRGRALPLKVSATHGVLGILAIVLLVMQAMAHPANHPANLAILIFMLAALGGLLLFAFRAAKQALPLGVVLLHGLFAVVGLLFLVVGCLRAGG
ncbi:MAG TPA: hypothetical protein VLV87_01265 [Gammaproteobacteria bacterium]|nr:hypothetical protein [Gammaproteobacteria bacterium]